MQWSEAYSTGIPELDAQHIELFAMTSSFEGALERGEGEPAMGAFLARLSDHSRVHFGAEEACMRRHACPIWQLNQSAHEFFRANLRRIADRHAAEGYVQEDAEALVAMLHRWLHEHIARIDAQLRPLAEEGGRS